MQSTEILTLESVQIPRFREAYDTLLPVIATLPERPGCPLEVEVPTLVARILRAWPLLVAHQNRLALEQPHFDLRELELLKQYAWALGHAHSLHVSAAAALADCLAIPEQARVFYRNLLAKMDGPVPAMEPLTAVALAGAIAERLHVSDDPILACRAQMLIDKLEAFTNHCGKTQDRLFETSHHRSVLLGLSVATYDRVRIAVLALRKGDPEVAAQFPDLIGP